MIVHENKHYLTAEHCTSFLPSRFSPRFPVLVFQAHKFLEHHPETAECIQHQPTARRAREEAGRLRRLQRSDWFTVNVAMMDRVLELKFLQHPELARMLLSTGGRELVEDSPVRRVLHAITLAFCVLMFVRQDDMFWGVGRDRTGRNELGKALMRLRDKLAATS
jgi:predicted NAD-dependent protein-ADP-ribosyltransferase YbiA (DUF1768 family)